MARRELFLRGAAPVAVCPNHGQPEPLDLTAGAEPPDYEEGLQTGLEPDDLPPPEAVPADEREGEDAEDRGDDDKTAAPADPPSPSPAPSPSPDAAHPATVADPSPAPSPSPPTTGPSPPI
jgi:hypothetical protein